MKSQTDEEFYSGFTPVVIREKTFDVGTKVFIKDRRHPAYGQTGVIVVAPRDFHDGIVLGTWAEVEVDGWAGHKCGVQPHQMRELR